MSGQLIGIPGPGLPAPGPSAEPFLPPSHNKNGGFTLGPATYIIGIVLLMTVAICIVLLACLLHRKDRRHLAALAALRAQQLAAAQAEADCELARRLAHPVVIPVVIVQPDGDVILAEQCIVPNSADSAPAQHGGQPKGELSLAAGADLEAGQPQPPSTSTTTQLQLTQLGRPQQQQQSLALQPGSRQ